MKSKFNIAGRDIGTDFPPYLIAELSANHNGSIERAIRSISAAKESGADAIKLQTYTADTMTIESNRPEFQISTGLWNGYSLYDLYTWAHTPFEWHKPLFEHAASVGITIFSSPFDDSAVDLLEELNAPAYKIASFEIIDLPLIKRVAKTGKPVIISTGMASLEEVSEAIETATNAGCEQIAILHCTSSYPADLKDLNLAQISNLSSTFNKTVGFSDHSLGIAAATASITLGASIIEKHFTYDKDQPGPDSQFSSDPKEFKELSQQLHNSWLSLGKVGFDRPFAENQSKKHRRSIYFVRDLKEGHIIQSSDIRRIRPGMGLPPKYFDEILGKRLTKEVERGTPVSWSLLTD